MTEVWRGGRGCGQPIEPRQSVGSVQTGVGGPVSKLEWGLAAFSQPTVLPMRSCSPLPLALVAILPGALLAQDYTAPRTATVPARGAQRIEVIGRAGSLRIDGRAGATEVTVRGTARASSRARLEEVRLIAEVKNGTIYVEADIPEHDWQGWDDSYQALDLTIEVPAQLPIDVEDGSGDLEIRNVGDLDVRDGSGEMIIEHVAGRLRVKDGSGSVRITDVRGDVDASDGSGDLEIRDVQGGVDVDRKGSGELRVANVTKSVHVGSKGSGTVDVSRVGGDFVVDQKARGDIEYADVKGRVDIPRTERRRWR
jgi:hypothetical protein